MDEVQTSHFFFREEYWDNTIFKGAPPLEFSNTSTDDVNLFLNGVLNKRVKDLEVELVRPEDMPLNAYAEVINHTLLYIDPDSLMIVVGWFDTVPVYWPT